MKLLSIAIPCYNSAEYMEKAVNSCLILGDDVEIIIVDDGSAKDDTLQVGKRLEAQHPGIVKCIHQENGGHGRAVNTGLANATGRYFKVLDSDDWLDSDVLVKVAEKLKQLHNDSGVDMFITNYVYDKPCENRASVIHYGNALPVDRVFGWDEVGHFYPHQNIIMHSVIYRTQLLKDCGLQLPEHTFYVDNIFVYRPLPFVQKMYYMDTDLYHYFIGRGDQSVNEKVMIGRMDQQIRVNKLLIDCCDVMALENEHLCRYMIKYLTMISTVTTVLCIKSGTEEHLKMKDDLWRYMNMRNPEMFKKVKRTVMGRAMQMHSSMGKKMITAAYSVAQKIFVFN